MWPSKPKSFSGVKSKCTVPVRPAREVMTLSANAYPAHASPCAPSSPTATGTESRPRAGVCCTHHHHQRHGTPAPRQTDYRDRYEALTGRSLRVTTGTCTSSAQEQVRPFHSGFVTTSPSTTGRRPPQFLVSPSRSTCVSDRSPRSRNDVRNRLPCLPSADDLHPGPCGQRASPASRPSNTHSRAPGRRFSPVHSWLRISRWRAGVSSVTLTGSVVDRRRRRRPHAKPDGIPKRGALRR